VVENKKMKRKRKGGMVENKKMKRKRKGAGSRC
jgi:hypothetical protein